MAKKQKDFFIPARLPSSVLGDQTGWYQAQPTDVARAAVERAGNADGGGRPDVYYVAGAKRADLGRVYAAPDHYNLMHQLARDSAGVRQELGTALAKHLAGVNANERVLEWMKNTSQIEASIRWLDRQDDLEIDDFDVADYPAGKKSDYAPETIAEYHQAMEQAANLGMLELRRYDEANPKGDPKSDFRRRMDHHALYQLDTATKSARILVDLAVNTELLGPGKAIEIAGDAFANTLTPDQLVRSHDALIANLRADQRWYDDRAKQVRGPHIGAVGLATRHWDEINADGRYAGGISIGNGRQRLITADTVREIGVRMTEQADIDAAITKPKTAPAAPGATGPDIRRTP